MSANVITCLLGDALKTKLKEFRFKKNKEISALILKINKNNFEFEEEDSLSGITLGDLAEELPETSSRYVLLSYVFQHKDGRVSYPLVFIYWSPVTVNPEMNMLYAGAKTQLVRECEVRKVFDIRTVKELNDAWLCERLGLI